MKLALVKDSSLFFGCKIDSKLREALAQAKPGDRRYFEDEEAGFLRICEVGEEKWIGKVVPGGMSVTEVEDVQRNVLSIIRRIAPDVRKAASTVKIFGMDKIAEPTRAESGPYIDNY